MAWKIELTPLAEKHLGKLDPPVARRIVSFLKDRLAVLEDPRSLGEALKGSTLGELWKYRVGDYRIISSIEDDRLLIYVVRIGNRREDSRNVFQPPAGEVLGECELLSLRSSSGFLPFKKFATIRERRLSAVVTKSPINHCANV